jgi:hypothetical protein
VIEVFSRTGLYIRRVQGSSYERGTGGEVLWPRAYLSLKTNLARERARRLESIVEFMAGNKTKRMFLPTGVRRRGPKNVLRLFTKAKMPSAKFAMCSGRLILPKHHRASIRKEFGQTIMINAAHASDSAENAKREMGIVEVEEITLNL